LRAARIIGTIDVMANKIAIGSSENISKL